MSNLFSNIAYAKLTLDYDKELFLYEYDKVIIPNSTPFVAISDQWHQMDRLNHIWNIIPDADLLEINQAKSKGTAINYKGNTHQWDMVNLLELDTGERGGGACWRNKNRYATKQVRHEFKDLEIVRWIYSSIPADQIVGIHCVSIEPGGFSSIHRDAFWDSTGANPAASNGFYNDGFVVICLNISNGGVPLLWALDHDTTPRQADDDCYMISDYFRHAVPVVNSRRRQIRIAIKPTAELINLVDNNSKITVGDDYQYMFTN